MRPVRIRRAVRVAALLSGGTFLVACQDLPAVHAGQAAIALTIIAAAWVIVETLVSCYEHTQASTVRLSRADAEEWVDDPQVINLHQRRR